MSETASPIAVNVSGHSDIELFVVDHALQLVVRGTLPWSGTLAPGVYKFKFRRGTAIEEQHVMLRPGSPAVTLAAPKLTTASPAPLEASSRTHEYHIGAASQSSRQVHEKFGAGGQLFLLVRDWTTHNEPTRTPQPAAGLHICDAAGTVLFDVEKVTAGVRDQDRWATVNIEVNPGSYRLRLETRQQGTFEQTIVVSPGWQTQVFLLLTNYSPTIGPDSKNGADWRADLNRASILMAERGRGFDPASHEFRLADTACAWLGSRQQTAAAAGLKHALQLKFNNPMLGIYAAHALTSGPTSKEMEKSPPIAESLFRDVVSNLEYLVPGHPDVQALRLWLDGAASVNIPPLHMPPMLTSSWMKFVEASATRRELIARGSLASRIGGCVWGNGPWLIWAADDVGRQRKGVEDLDILTALDRLQETNVDAVDLSGLESALMQQAAVTTSVVGQKIAASMPGRRRRAKSAAELVSRLGVPLETLQAAAIDLLEKTSRKK